MTQKPVTFREFGNMLIRCCILILDARFAGNCEISEYYNECYANDKEFSTFIKSNCSEILKNHFSDDLKRGEIKCKCGQVFSGKFCPNFGLPLKTSRSCQDYTIVNPLSTRATNRNFR